jgi:hypothetical protein
VGRGRAVGRGSLWAPLAPPARCGPAPAEPSCMLHCRPSYALPQPLNPSPHPGTAPPRPRARRALRPRPPTTPPPRARPASLGGLRTTGPAVSVARAPGRGLGEARACAGEGDERGYSHVAWAVLRARGHQHAKRGPFSFLQPRTLAASACCRLHPPAARRVLQLSVPGVVSCGGSGCHEHWRHLHGAKSRRPPTGLAGRGTGGLVPRLWRSCVVRHLTRLCRPPAAHLPSPNQCRRRHQLHVVRAAAVHSRVGLPPVRGRHLRGQRRLQ